jgi:Uncharacterized protein conserved in bacteria
MILAKVTKIQAQKRKGRYNVYLDGKYAFPVAETTLIEYRLMKDVELTKEQVEEIKTRENINKAYGDAVNYLSYQLRTKKEITDYLYKKEYDPDTVDTVIKRLADLNYLDDGAYADSFIATQLKTTANGPKIIQQKLSQKGVPNLIVQEKIETINQDLLLENASEFAQNKLKNRRISFKQTMTKLRQSLYQKGYSGDLITQVIDDLDLEPDEEQEVEKLKK